MVTLVIVMFVVLMMFQPSRSLAVSIVRWSETTFVQPLISAPKCPPRRSLIPDSVSPSQRVSERILSAWPDFGLPVMRFPPPSIVPAPVKPMFVSLSP